MKILKRSDNQYLAVEQFKEYELTYCMAYEMAIRNDEVIKTIYSFYNNYINDDLYDCFVLTTDDFKKCYNDSQKLMKFFINPLSLYLDYHLFKNINKHIQELKEDDIKENSDYFTRRLRRILYEPKKDYYHEDIKPTEKLIAHKVTPLYTEFISHLKSEDEEDAMIIHYNDITPNYSRPLALDFSKIKERRVILNLALPTNELVDFIERLKRKYDNDQTIIKNVSQLLNEEFENTSIKLPSIQKNYADMLFCYDCYKLGFKPTKILSKIDRYREDNNAESTTISINTIKKYIEISKDYIDNQKYKQLLT